MSRVLVIEDEKRLLRSIRSGLAEEGFEPLSATNGATGLEIALAQPVDLLILDLMLPGLPGLDVLRQLREKQFRQPILILTACDRVRDRVAGLQLGADDYLVKPFAYAELLARVKSLLRRGPLREEVEVVCQGLRLDLLQRRAYRGEIELTFSTREFDVLAYLLRRQGVTVTREMLARDLWQDEQTLMTNVIDVFINRLRRKLDEPGRASLIQTIRGSGYRVGNELA
jgi:DNA-binding response OmpR family regulator